MITKLNEKVFKHILSNQADRIYICGQEPVYFFAYYFAEYLSYKIAPFQFLFYDDIKRLIEGELDEAIWVAFRESAKTSIAKFALAVWCICYRKKRYINFDSYIKDNAEAALFDIAVTLQTNRNIIEDFGHLYFSREARTLKEAKLKRIAHFITENDVKVEAFSTQESTRGRIYKEIRPDLYVFDDIETAKTKSSYPITKKIIEHIDEAKAGLGPGGSILYLGNYITEEGVIAHIMKNLKGRKRAVVRNIPVMISGEITWPDKYVKTNEEAIKLNKMIKEPSEKKVSLKAKRESLGNEVYETEMMNNPSKSEDLVFDSATIDKLIRGCQPPIEEIAGLKIWAKFNAKHRYGEGGDTAEGIGRDANALVVIDFTKRPALVVATFENNQIGPDVFGYEMKRAANLYGGCIVAPEVNNTGYATLAVLTDIYDNKNIYVRTIKDKTSGKPLKSYGFKSTSTTKPDIMYQLKSAIEDGELEILDEALLKEIRAYRKQDIRLLKSVEGMTKHFDKLMACAIAWEMRHHALVKKKKKSLKQPVHVPTSEYEGR